MKAVTDGEPLPGSLECLTPAATGPGGILFLDHLPSLVSLQGSSEMEPGQTEDGVVYGRRTVALDGLIVSVYLVMDEEHELQAIASMPPEMAEDYGALVELIVRSVSFDG